MSHPKGEKALAILRENYFGAERHEKELMERIQPYVNEASAFIDVGASLGPYTKMAMQNPLIELVVACEPDKLRFNELLHNVEEWSAKTKGNAIPLNVAVSDRQGVAEFFTYGSNTSGSMASISGRLDDAPKVSVETCTLDELAAEHGFTQKSCFIKVDVEGTEYRVVSGANALLASGLACWLIELHSWGDLSLGKFPNDVLKLMRDFGYGFEAIDGHFLFAKSLPTTALKYFRYQLYFYAKVRLRRLSFMRALVRRLRRSK